jgi:hypothetical protein
MMKEKIADDKKSSTFTVTIDESSAKRGIQHYAAIWLWIGWTFFYLLFMFTSPLLFLYAKPLLTIIVGLMVISAFFPTKRELQPKVLPTALA